jgi:hypothetical protein
MTNGSRVALWVRAITLVGAFVFVVFGLWALVAPLSFFETVATFEPYNPHLLHDVGAFQLGLGIVLLLAAFPERIDGLAAALIGVGSGAAAHLVSHLVDMDLGGNPASDTPILSVLAAILFIAGIARWRATTQSGGQSTQ